jgi:hypothetical protein
MADCLSPLSPVELPIGLFSEHGYLIAFVQTVLDVLGLFAPCGYLKPDRFAVHPLIAFSDPWRVGQRETGDRLSLTVMAESRICSKPAIEGNGLVLD